jgi:hypothetical protein
MQRQRRRRCLDVNHGGQMNRWLGIAAALALSSTGYAQGMQVDTPNGQVRVGLWGYQGHHGGRFAENERDHRLVVERDPQGRTRIKVMAPEGAMLHVFQDRREIYVDDVPTVFQAQPGVRYRLELVFADGSRWRKHVETQPGAVARLWVLGPDDDDRPQDAATVDYPRDPTPAPVAYSPPAPEAPQPMERHRFEQLKRAIEAESFAEQKLGVLQSAAGGSYFTIHQVGELVDLYNFAQNKVQAVRLVRRNRSIAGVLTATPLAPSDAARGHRAARSGASQAG